MIFIQFSFNKFSHKHIFGAIVHFMNKSSVKKSRASGKSSRVTAKKAVKAKSARRSATAQAREASKSKAASAARISQGKSTKTAAAKSTVAKTAPKPVAKSTSKPTPKSALKAAAVAKPDVKPASKATQRSVQSIAEAMKTAKLALIAAANARQVRVPSPTVVPPAEPVTHKFQVGQVVYYSAPTFGRAPAPGNFTVVKLLPSEGDEQQYRIKSNGEAFERVAKESQLDVV